jgi:hypothetical protein
MQKRLGVVLLAPFAALAACSSRGPSEVTRLSVSDFARPPAGVKTDVVEVSPEVIAPPTVEVVEEEIRNDDRDFTVRREEITSKNADGSTSVDAVAPVAVARVLDAGQSWPVEGLVGQVNGRPIFADAFFEPIEDQLLQAVGIRDRVEARRALIDVVRRWFKETVDSELIVAEAESKLSPEQQQGLFAWIRSVQEETIAERGGSRAAAEASLEAEASMSLDEFLRQRRDIALARKLLNERIEPRTIVSWRDITQEYERREAEFNPPPTIRIGRIRVATTDTEKIALVKERIASGKRFSEIATELKLPDGGLWNTFDLPPEGIRGLQLSDTQKERLEGLAVDAVSTPFEQRDFISWLAILSIDTRAERSIYDRDVQLQLAAELKGRRELIERERYISTLRSRWVTDDISDMERRLLEIAVERYWR